MTTEEIREHVAAVAARIRRDGLTAIVPTPPEQMAFHLAVDLLLNGSSEERP